MPFFCAVEIVTQSHPSESVLRWPRPRIGFCGDDGSGGANAKGFATWGRMGSLPLITLFSGASTSLDSPETMNVVAARSMSSCGGASPYSFVYHSTKCCARGSTGSRRASKALIWL